MNAYKSEYLFFRGKKTKFFFLIIYYIPLEKYLYNIHYQPIKQTKIRPTLFAKIYVLVPYILHISMYIQHYCIFYY